MRALTIALLSLLPLATASVEAGTRFTYVSDPHDFVGQGRSGTLTDAHGTWLVSRNFDQGISFRFSGSNPTAHWHLDFAAPFDADLTTGDYPDAQRWPLHIRERPGLSVSGEGRGCNTLSGRFTVASVNYGFSAQVIRFSATFTQHCEEGNPALRGRIDFVDDSIFIFTDGFEASPSMPPDPR